MVCGVVLVIIGLLAWKLGPPAWDRIALLDAQRRCLNVVVPPVQVAFDNDPARGRTLLGKDPQYMTSGSAGPVFWCSRDWSRFISRLQPPGQRDAATVYMGERLTPGGKRRFVVVRAVPADFGATGGVYLSATVVEPGSLLSPPRQLPTAGTTFETQHPFEAGKPVRYFAGQSDPADNRHFTLTYESGGETQVIDCWLRDDDRIVYEQHGPPASALPHHPADAPATRG